MQSDDFLAYMNALVECACSQCKSMLTTMTVEMPMTMVTFRWHYENTQIVKQGMRRWKPHFKHLVSQDLTCVDDTERKAVDKLYDDVRTMLRAMHSYRDKCGVNDISSCEAAKEMMDSEVLKALAVFVVRTEGMELIVRSCLGQAAKRFTKQGTPIRFSMNWTVLRAHTHATMSSSHIPLSRSLSLGPSPPKKSVT